MDVPAPFSQILQHLYLRCRFSNGWGGTKNPAIDPTGDFGHTNTCRNLQHMGQRFARNVSGWLTFSLLDALWKPWKVIEAMLS